MRLPIPLPHRRHRTLPVPGLVLGAAMALTACGGSGFDTKFGDSAEAAEDSTDGSGGATTGGPGMADEEVILDFYQCLRDNGMDVEDPDLSGGQGVRIGGGPGGGAIDPNDPEQMTILEDCRSEIGLRRALGATRAHVRRQFLGESVLLAGLGGVGGAVLGGAATAVFATSRDWPFALPLWVLGGAAGATVIVGALAGAYPAARAARMPPTAALATT